MYYYIESSLVGLYSVWFCQVFANCPFVYFWIGCSREFILMLYTTTAFNYWNSIIDGCLFTLIINLIEHKDPYIIFLCGFMIHYNNYLLNNYDTL